MPCNVDLTMTGVAMSSLTVGSEIETMRATKKREEWAGVQKHLGRLILAALLSEMFILAAVLSFVFINLAY